MELQACLKSRKGVETKLAEIPMQLLSRFWMGLGLLLRKQEISEKTVRKNVKNSQFYKAPLGAQMSVSTDKEHT